ncbi:dihydrofolate reductase [Fulvivirgaceae bacterium BMA10]|uniref:Dihydrofolate reductase n=1 Tax=Splendidivirga corallicola TaxID=3051826 RepID=A0ABT8KI14_9BACT|nr:dihydrofolate reductase [Fulvivirgaceae bacterium BMA10]
MPKTIIISAMSNNRVIGSGGGMPWNAPDEYQQYLSFVNGNAVIMGRRSFEIFGKDLKGTHNIVVSRSSFEMKDAIVCSSVDDALRKARLFDKTIFIAGGATIYEQTIPLVDEMYLSYIKGSFQGDTYFPDFDINDWDIAKKEDKEAFEFVIYRRK